MDALPVSIRLNPFKGPDGPDGKPVPWSPWGRILDSRPQFILDPLMHAGCYYVQDSSAMFPGHIFRRELRRLGPPRGIRVLDLCAAPGGKTTDLAASLREACGDDFTLISNEVMRGRASTLVQNVSVWGDPAVKVVSADPSVFGRLLPGCFDIILADVPCSGEGMFRKDPRAEQEWSPAVVELCAARQRRILADVWPALREGGILIYSTCTYEDAENDSNLRWAAETLGGEILPAEGGFEEFGVRTTDCGNLLRAGEVPGEGQWAGALVKTSPQRPARRMLAPSWTSRRPSGTCTVMHWPFRTPLRAFWRCATAVIPSGWSRTSAGAATTFFLRQEGYLKMYEKDFCDIRAAVLRPLPGSDRSCRTCFAI